MILRTTSLILIFILLIRCEESTEVQSTPEQELEIIKKERVAETCTEPKTLTTQDSVFKIFSVFLPKVNSEWLDDTYNYAKRIDRISSSRISVINYDNSHFKTLIIKHEDPNEDYFLAEVTVLKDFDIESLNNGWVCSMRNRDDLIHGPLAIYYPNFIEMFTTTYEEGKKMENTNTYDSLGGIMVQAIDFKCN